MANEKDLYKKISALSDLKDAIREVKKTMKPSEESSASASKSIPEVKKAEPTKPAEEKPMEGKQHGLGYLGRKLANGKITHMIGSGKDNDNHYQVEVDLSKHSRQLPAITLSHVSPKGVILDQHSEQHKSLKNAIQALMSHHMKKSWK